MDFLHPLSEGIRRDRKEGILLILLVNKFGKSAVRIQPTRQIYNAGCQRTRYYSGEGLLSVSLLLTGIYISRPLLAVAQMFFNEIINNFSTDHFQRFKNSSTFTCNCFIPFKVK